MLVIRVFYKHQGVGEEKQIGLMELFNDGTGTEEMGNYAARIYKGAGTAEGFDIWRAGKVKRFPRHHPHLGIWDLLYLALRVCVGFRNLKEKKPPQVNGAAQSGEILTPAIEGQASRVDKES